MPLFGLLFLLAEDVRAATVGTARISVFKQGSSSDRAVGSLIGVWDFQGCTFANQHSNVWQRAFPDVGSAFDLLGVAVDPKDPAYAFALGERGALRFTGTTWDYSIVRNLADGGLYPIAVLNSSFALLGGGKEDLWRWSGTSWLHDIDHGAGFRHRVGAISLFATDFAFAFIHPDNTAVPSRAVLRWRGTSWQTHLQQSADALGMGGMVSTDYGWYFGRPASDGVPNIYQWRGTSWQIFSQLDPWGDINLTDAAFIRHDPNFGIVVGQTGELWRWAGTSWLSEKLTTENLNRVVAVQTDHAWVVGNAGHLWRWTGTSWVSHGPLTAANLSGVAAVRTDYAVVCGGGDDLWFWRGTSWLQDEGHRAAGLTFNQVATAGATMTHMVGNQGYIARKTSLNVADDGVGALGSWSGTMYRTVVQIMPTDSVWNWNGQSSDTDSYFGVINKDGNSYDFLDEGDSDNSSRQIVLKRSVDSLNNREDIFIWEDTVGWWDGHSSAHNRNATSGTNFVFGGIVHNDLHGSLNADVWGETDGRITSAESSSLLSTDRTWEEAVGNFTVLADGSTLTWEFWHCFDAGFGQGESIETAIHVEKEITDLSTDTLEGISWEYRVGHYRPRIGNWRWCRDDAAAPQIMKEPRGRLLEAAPTGERLRLRVRVDETDGGRMPSAVGSSGWTLWYSSDQTNWTQVTTASSVWKLVDGQGAAGGAASAATMPEVDTLGIVVESDTANNGKAQEGFTEMEMDFAIESTAAAQNTIYYFEPRHNGHRALPVPGVGYPSVQTLEDSAFNYLYTRPDLGRFSRPLVNPALLGGEAFKVVYVGTQGGASDQLFAISRTNGGVVRSYSASGTLEHGNLYWDSTNSRYNLFFRQGNSSILALQDDGATITANASWTTNPLDTTNLIGRPVRVFDADKQNYLMVLVTSFQGNTNTLYKIRAADGTVVPGGVGIGYSGPAGQIGWNKGLRITDSLYPLWVEGNTFSLGLGNDGPIKITPAAVGTQSAVSSITFNPIFVASPTYTRTTITTGGRIMFAHEGFVQGMSINTQVECPCRVNDADMRGAEWQNGSHVGMGADISNDNGIDTVPYSPPFQSHQPVPAFIGANNAINRISGTDGSQEANFPYSLTGGISTEIMIKGDWLYFGTDGGYIYALSATDPTQGAGTRFRVPGDRAVVGVAIDGTNSLVYYTTRDGRIYQFDTR